MARRQNRFISNVSIECEAAKTEREYSPTLKNISVDGMCFASETELAINETVMITIPMLQPMFRVAARVVWCEHNGRNYDVGVRFIHVESGYRITTVETLRYIDQYRRRVYNSEGRLLSGDQAYKEFVENMPLH